MFRWQTLVSSGAIATVMLATVLVQAHESLPIETALARTFVREAGLRAYARDDGPAIHAVVEFRAERIYRSTYAEALRRATRGAFARRDRPRPWIVDLVPEAHAPRGYPAGAAWEHGRVHWLRTYQTALDVLQGQRHHVCDRTPHTWGSAHDAVRFRRMEPTAIELDCGDTCARDAEGEVLRARDGLPLCNVFFHVPRYGARWEAL